VSAYTKVMELLEKEGWPTTGLPEENGLVILPIDGQYNHLAEELRWLGAVWDKNNNQWVVQKG